MSKLNNTDYKNEFMKIEPVKSLTILDHDETLYMSPWDTGGLSDVLSELEIPYKKIWHSRQITMEEKQKAAKIWFPRMREFGLGFDDNTDINNDYAVYDICSYTLPLSWQDTFKLFKAIEDAYDDKTSEFAKIYFAMKTNNDAMTHM
jgi:hypothetical protein